MANGELQLDALNGSIFFQPDGPGTPVQWLGCHDADDVEAPKGEIEIEQNYRPDRSGWDVIGQTKSAPEIVTTTITGITKKTRDFLEKARCTSGALYIAQSSCGRKENPDNWERVKVLHHINIASVTYSGTAHHKEANKSTHSMSIQAWPPLIEAVESVIGRLPVSETQAINDVWADTVGQCLGDCGGTINPGDIAVAACDSAVGPATGNILFSTDGLAFAAGSADPFGAGFHTMAVAAFPINKSGRRVLVGRDGPAGAQGQVAYSDDNGASWTVRSLGGATAGHGPAYGGAIYAPSGDFIVLASKAGFIYKSTDRGETWRAVESGVIAVGNYNHVHFADEKYGAAVGASGVVAVTSDGGNTWRAATVITGTPVLNTCFVFSDRRIQVGTATGQLWQSTDFGVTWQQITGWQGSGIGQVRDIDYVNEFVGFMAVNNAAPIGTVLRTVNGGATWVTMTTPLNAGLNVVRALTENSCFVAGEPQAGTPVLLKVTEA